MKMPLTCVINRRIYMAYGPRHRCPESRAAQLGSHPATGTRVPARGRRTPRPGLLHLQAPSLSLSRASTAAQASGPGRRCQIVIYGEALPQPGGETAHLRCFHRIDPERDRQPCLVGGAPSWGRTWLTDRRVGNGRCGSNINLIGCWRRSWRTLMNCSCPTMSVPRPEPVPASPPANRSF